MFLPNPVFSFFNKSFNPIYVYFHLLPNLLLNFSGDFSLNE